MTWFTVDEPAESDEPGAAPRATAVLAHGAGGNRDALVLRLLGAELAARGVRCIRIDLPYRRTRPKGPPSPSGQPADRAAFAEAAAELELTGPIVWGGHSYGGRMASMAVADFDENAPREARPAALLLSSYPLHPPGKPEKSRTEHLPRIAIPTVLVHGARDPFATPAELDAAVALIGAETSMVRVAAGHDLSPARSDAPALAADALVAVLGAPPS